MLEKLISGELAEEESIESSGEKNPSGENPSGERPRETGSGTIAKASALAAGDVLGYVKAMERVYCLFDED